MRSVVLRRLRLAAHVLFAVAGWLLFAAMWLYAFDNDPPDEGWAWTLAALAAFSLATLLLTAGWVRYNVDIYRRKGKRTGLPPSEGGFVTDVLGRPLEGDLAALREARRVRIDVRLSGETTVKRYSAITGERERRSA